LPSSIAAFTGDRRPEAVQIAHKERKALQRVAEEVAHASSAMPVKAAHSITVGVSSEHQRQFVLAAADRKLESLSLPH
jgi:hypothetical protein